MKYSLKHKFRIESARFLPLLPKNHPCSQTHGHSFEITVQLVGELDAELGWLVDYHEIQQKVQAVLKEIDHRLLNDVPGLENPTTELLTQWLFKKIKKELPTLTQVFVKETPDTECSYPT